MLDNPTRHEGPLVGPDPIEMRCECGKLMLTLLDDFDGWLSVPCRRCKKVLSIAPDGRQVPDRRIECGNCGRWLLTGLVLRGVARVQCGECGLIHVGAKGSEIFAPSTRLARTQEYLDRKRKRESASRGRSRQPDRGAVEAPPSGSRTTFGLSCGRAEI